MEKNFLIPKIDDNLNIVKRADVIKFIGFLNEFELSEAKAFLKSKKDVNHMFFGGYDSATRVILGLSSGKNRIDFDDFPISVIKYTFKGKHINKHSYVLGALMNLNISRETIGDIIIGESEKDAIVFVLPDVMPLCLEVDQIGKNGVIAELIQPTDVNANQHFEHFSGSVASNRLDCIVSLFCGLSREKACELIKSKMVFINSITEQSASKKVKVNDIVTIRKSGKFIILSDDKTTRKGKIIIEYDKYS